MPRWTFNSGLVTSVAMEDLNDCSSSIVISLEAAANTELHFITISIKCTCLHSLFVKCPRVISFSDRSTVCDVVWTPGGKNVPCLKKLNILENLYIRVLYLAHDFKFWETTENILDQQLKHLISEVDWSSLSSVIICLFLFQSSWIFLAIMYSTISVYQTKQPVFF